jgi:hypothetical protein
MLIHSTLIFMKRLATYVVLFIVFNSSFVEAQNMHYYGGDTTNNHYHPSDLLETQNGEFVVVADVNARGYLLHNVFFDRYLVRLKAVGDTVWTQRHTQTSGNGHILEKSDGSLVVLSGIDGAYTCGVVGQTYPYLDYNIKTYSSTGNLLTNTAYSDGCYDYLVGTTRHKDGTILTTHTTETANYIKEVDAAGQLISVRLPSGMGNGLVEKHAAGGYWLWRFDSLYHIDLAGSVQQRHALSNPPYLNKVIHVQQDSFLAVASNTNVSALDLTHLNKYDQTGNLDWSVTFEMETHDVVQHSSGNYVLTGTRNDQISILLVSPDGDSLWSRTHSLPRPCLAVKTIESSAGKLVTLAQERSYFTMELGRAVVIFDELPTFTSTQKIEPPLALQYYPNPSRGQTTFVVNSTAHASYQVEVVSMVGQSLLSRNFSGNQFTLTTKNLPQGMYRVRVSSEEGAVFEGGKLVVLE